MENICCFLLTLHTFKVDVKLTKKYLPRARPRLNLYEVSISELRYRAEQSVCGFFVQNSHAQTTHMIQLIVKWRKHLHTRTHHAHESINRQMAFAA